MSFELEVTTIPAISRSNKYVETIEDFLAANVSEAKVNPDDTAYKTLYAGLKRTAKLRFDGLVTVHGIGGNVYLKRVTN